MIKGMTGRARPAVGALLLALGGCASAPPPALKPIAPVVMASPSPFNPAASDVLFRAIGLVGTPYRWGGNTPDSGFDCSGLIGYVYRDAAGISLPRTTGDLLRLQGPNVARGALQSGDLVFFATGDGGRVSHAGIYVGEGRFVHAPSAGGTVRLDYLDQPYWQKAYLNAKRVFAPAPVPLAQGGL